MAPSPVLKALIRLLLAYPALCMALPTKPVEKRWDLAELFGTAHFPAGTDWDRSTMDMDVSAAKVAGAVNLPTPTESKPETKRLALTEENLAALNAEEKRADRFLPHGAGAGAEAVVNPAAMPDLTDIHSIDDLARLDVDGDGILRAREWDPSDIKNPSQGFSVVSSAKSGCSDEGGCPDYVACLKSGGNVDSCYHHLEGSVIPNLDFYVKRGAEDEKKKQDHDAMSKAESVASSAKSGCSDQDGCSDYTDCLRQGIHKDECQIYLPDSARYSGGNEKRGEKEDEKKRIEDAKSEAESVRSSAKSGCSDEGGCPVFVECMDKKWGNEKFCERYLNFKKRSMLTAEELSQELHALRQQNMDD